MGLLACNYEISVKAGDQRLFNTLGCAQRSQTKQTLIEKLVALYLSYMLLPIP
jgi:hypothetical protein